MSLPSAHDALRTAALSHNSYYGCDATPIETPEQMRTFMDTHLSRLGRSAGTTLASVETSMTPHVIGSFLANQYAYNTKMNCVAAIEVNPETGEVEIYGAAHGKHIHRVELSAMKSHEQQLQRHNHARAKAAQLLAARREIAAMIGLYEPERPTPARGGAGDDEDTIISILAPSAKPSKKRARKH